jgi:hypothetical protein
MDWKFS